MEHPTQNGLMQDDAGELVRKRFFDFLNNFQYDVDTQNQDFTPQQRYIFI